MAQALAINDIIKAQLWSSDAEQAAVNTFHYKVTAVTGIVPSLTDFLTDWTAAVTSEYLALLANAAHYDGAFAQIVFPLPLMTGEKNTFNAGQGTGGVDGMARQVAGLVSWRTPLAGPGGRGRTYIPFVPTDACLGLGIPSAAYIALLTTWVTAMAAFNTVTGTGGNATVSLGLKHGGAGVFTTFTDGLRPAKFATQKRRGSYGRPNQSPF